MGYVEKLMGRNERIVFITRQHWLVLFGSLVANAFLSVLIWVIVIALNMVVPGSPP